MQLYRVKKSDVLVCEKRSNSSFDIIKNKLLKLEKDESGRKKQKQQGEFK